MAILAECAFCQRKQSVRNKHCVECGEGLDKQKRSRKVRFWINYRLPGGKQRREPVGYSIKEAQDADGKRRGQKREGRIFDMMPDTKMTFNELTEWYLSLEKVKTLSSYWLVKLSLEKFNKIFGDMAISQIKPADLENYQARRLKEGKAPATIDHEIGKAKTMVFKAFDNDLVGGDTLKTFKRIKKLLKKGQDVRDRILYRLEFDDLMAELPQHLKGIVAMAYYTGMRKGEILSLTWDRVDLKQRVIDLDPEHTKDHEARKVPISDELYSILLKIPRAIHNQHVFQFKGKSVSDIRTGLRKACKEAGIVYGRFAKNGFIFHDLRHTFNTNMRKAGVPESVIMAITGHSTREMFDRYNTIDGKDTKQAVDQMQNFLQFVD